MSVILNGAVAAGTDGESQQFWDELSRRFTGAAGGSEWVLELPPFHLRSGLQARLQEGPARELADTVLRCVASMDYCALVVLLAPWSYEGYLAGKLLGTRLLNQLDRAEVRVFLLRGGRQEASLDLAELAAPVLAAVGGTSSRTGAFALLGLDALSLVCGQLAAFLGWTVYLGGEPTEITALPAAVPIDLWRREFVLFEMAMLAKRPRRLSDRAATLLRAVAEAQPLHWLIRPAGPDGWPTCTMLGQELHAIARALHSDHVTGLYSRAFLEEVLLPWVTRVMGTRLACLILDIDDFSDVNDSFGHLVGDELLHSVGKRLQSELDHFAFPDAWCVRWGGDEFMVILLDLPEPAERIASRFRLRERLRDREVSCSVGVAEATCGPLRLDRLRSLIAAADEALLEAKRAGGGVRVWRPG